MSFATNSQLPLVSIVIPCHNAASRLDACLTSCIEQTYPNLEIIAVNNCSTDGTSNLVQQWIQKSERTIWLLNCEGPGANRARNLGFQKSRGEYIQWLDADDELALDKIARQVETLEHNPTIDIAYSDWNWRFDSSNPTVVTFQFQSQHYDDYLLQMLIDHWRPPHAYLLRHSIAQRLHNLQAWNPNTAVCMDREYFTIAALLGSRFLYVPNTSVTYCSWSSAQITRSFSYAKRVASLNTMFDRFQHLVENQSLSVQAHHRQLLHQPWTRWGLPSIAVRQNTTGEFLLQHLPTQETISISYSEAMILSAFLQSSGTALTLEDHARQVVQRLWYALLNRSSTAPDQPINTARLIQSLNQLVGLSDCDIKMSLPPIIPGHQPTPTDLKAIAQSLPFYAPIFSAQRFAVFQVLEQLQTRGWLAAVPNDFNSD